MKDRKFEIEIDGQSTLKLHASQINEMDLAKNPDGSYHLLLDQESFRLEFLGLRNQGKEYLLKVNGYSMLAKISDPIDQLVSKMGLSNALQNTVSEVKAPMPGLVLKIEVKVGDQVQAGQALFILEAMKMENVIKSPGEVTIAEILIKPGDAVEKGQVLIRFE